MHLSGSPQPASTSEPYDALWSGDFVRALALAHNVDRPGYVALRALAWFRLGEYDRTLAEYTRRHLSQYGAHEAVWLAAIAAEVHAVRGERERARETLAPALGLARRNGDAALIGLAMLGAASIAFRAGDLSAAEASIEEASRLADGLPAVRAGEPHKADAYAIRHRIAILRGRLHAARGEMGAHEGALVAGARFAADPHCPDRALEATILLGLARIAYGAPAPAARAQLLERLTTFPWSAHTDSVQTSIRRCLRNNARLFGFDNACVKKIGGRTAPSLALRLAECVDALRFDHWSEPQEFVRESRFCAAVALDVDWAHAPAEQLLDLASFAGAVAPFDLNLARNARRIFETHRSNAPSYASGSRLTPSDANVALADGAIAKAEGDLAAAVTRFASVAERAAPGDAPYLAAIAGLERFTITHLPGDLRPALEFAGGFPNAPFSERLRRALDALEGCKPGDFPYLGAYAPAAEGGAPASARVRRRRTA